MGESILSLNQDQLQLEQRLASGPSMSNLLEYAFRILTFFSDVSPSSEQSSRIRFELESISKQHSGGYFFTVLEEYTIHLLQNNTIEEYKRELRAKAN